jgi:25S rRNA (uracil2843-N3)-methyltransferase
MGKNGRFGKDYGRVVGKDSPSRPGWKGPGYVKKSEPAAKAKAKAAAPENRNLASDPVIPTELQQLLLDIFRNTFPEVLAADTLQPLLQDVKAALYDRDFSRAFGKPEYLSAYSVRWSPSRALCYLSILAGIQEQLIELLSLDTSVQEDSISASHVSASPGSTLKAVCFGGGAAEVIALGGLLKFLFGAMKTDEAAPEALGMLHGLGFDLHLVDTAHWGDVVQLLNSGLTSPPPISRYASSSAREANSALVPAENITTTFHANDVLDLSQDQLDDLAGKGPILLTLFFTLNELYTASIGKTTALLLSLSLTAKRGTLLLVVDSPGSYSETTVGKEAKKYPVPWLLDHALLGTEKSRSEEATASWMKVFSDDSRWFRLPDGLRYPIPLENMRYQISLYRKI